MKKKTPIIPPGVPFAIAVLMAYQRLLVVKMLISIYVLTLIPSGKLGIYFPK